VQFFAVAAPLEQILAQPVLIGRPDDQFARAIRVDLCQAFFSHGEHFFFELGGA
jgi:hypothetical protein